MAYYDPNDTMRVKPLSAIDTDTSICIECIKVQGQEFYDSLASLPQTADMTLAKRKVEEAVMWAVKAITA